MRNELEKSKMFIYVQWDTVSDDLKISFQSNILTAIKRLKSYHWTSSERLCLKWWNESPWSSFNITSLPLRRSLQQLTELRSSSKDADLSVKSHNSKEGWGNSWKHLASNLVWKTTSLLHETSPIPTRKQKGHVIVHSQLKREQKILRHTLNFH